MNRINRIGVTTQADGSIDIVVPAGMAEEFKLMVKKGTNLSPDMHVEVRDFADRILGRDSFVGSCMKQEIYGYPSMRQAIIMSVDGGGATDLVSTHWDIPSEDKFAIAADK